MSLSALRSCAPPSSWPEPPTEFSVSSLAEMEECPRRWALLNASYPAVWAYRGYPRLPSSSALAGLAVHLAIETVSTRLVRAGCASAQSHAAIDVMRELGGYTRVVEDSISTLLEGLVSNPRATAQLDALRRVLMAQVPRLRARVKKLLSRIRFVARNAAQERPRQTRARTALRPGTHTEVPLRAPTIGWRGTADLLSVNESGCEIVDFKAGATSDAHAFQLQVYALLWHLDQDLNPGGSSARRLTVAYEHTETEVPPLDLEELEHFRATLVERTSTARRAIAAGPPQTKPARDTCGWCQVRHLCPEYWQSSDAMFRYGESDGETYEDLELTLIGASGPGSWDATVVAACSVDRGRRVSLQLNATHHDVASPRRRLRLLGARVSDLRDPASAGDAILVTLTPWTEVFIPEVVAPAM